MTYIWPPPALRSRAIPPRGECPLRRGQGLPVGLRGMPVILSQRGGVVRRGLLWWRPWRDSSTCSGGVLVNNAARDDRHKFADVTPEYWDERMAINLRHHFFAIQAVVPRMAAAGGGSIINMSSIAWKIPSTGLPAYVTAKAAIVGLTRTIAHELGAFNIRVNCVLPGAIATERQRRLWYTPEYLEEILSAQALKRTLVPEDVARLVLFLAADDSEAITNQSYVIDGGWV